MGDSTVHINRVPKVSTDRSRRVPTHVNSLTCNRSALESITGSQKDSRLTDAPRDKAAASPRPSANPPEATYGIVSSLAALASYFAAVSRHH